MRLKITASFLLSFLMSGYIGLNATQKSDMDLPIKDIVAKYYSNKPFFVGSAGASSKIGKLSGKILDREFSYVTPSNDFKQSTIHPTPNVWQWEKPDAWIEHVKETGQILRLHAPISPQCSKWVRDDNRTPEELQKMMDEYLIALYTRYASNPQVKWVDVVNETISHENVKDPLGNFSVGDWFSRRSGTDKWENPWTLLGYDTTSVIKPPLYINHAFELAQKYAPNVKFILNQQGQFEPEVWDKVKKLVHYLRVEKGRRVDGIGWQAHVYAGWEKIPGNLERLSQFVDWCHTMHLEFHITEFNVYTNNKDKIYSDEEQADTFSAITKLLISKLPTGVIGINFWNIKDDETGAPEKKGAMWDINGKPKLAYYKFKETLISSATKN